MAKLFQTSDTTASVRGALDRFRHVVLNRSYASLTPVYYDTGEIADLPAYFFAKWDRMTFGQLARWRADGGVLIDRSDTSEAVGEHEALIHAECPLTVSKLFRSKIPTTEELIVRRPHSWSAHENTIALISPPVERCREIRQALYEVPERDVIAAVSKHPESLFVLTDKELERAAGLTQYQGMFLRRVQRPQEVWSVKLRIRPEREPALQHTWDLIAALPALSNGVRLFTDLGQGAAQWKRPLKELNRQGYISFTRYQVYPKEEPDWEMIQRWHTKAVKDLRDVRELVESLPAHPLA